MAPWSWHLLLQITHINKWSLGCCLVVDSRDGVKKYCPLWEAAIILRHKYGGITAAGEEAARWSSSGWRMTPGVQMSPSFLSVSGLFWARSQHGLLSLLLIPTLFVLLTISKGFNVFHTLRTKDGSEYVQSQRGSWTWSLVSKWHCEIMHY